MSIVWINHANQQLDPFDRGLAYGDGVFATMRTDNQGIQFKHEHLTRLTESCLRLGFNWSASNGLVQQLEQFAQTYPNHCLKLLVSRGVGGRGYQAPVETQCTEVLSVHPLPLHYPQWQQQGISLTTSAIQLAKQPLLAGVKHLNRLEQVMIKSQSLPSGFDDWLVLDTDNCVIESSVANIFLVKDDTVYTPALTYAGVAGMMREQVMQTLLARNFSIMVKDILIEDISIADNVFITNSLFGLVNINQIDTFHYSSWQMVQELRQILRVEL